jgi:uncharacterized C2H2 Zn-finger protein
MKCFICKKVFNQKKENYGWHVNKQGELEKCAYQNMPMQYHSRPQLLRKIRSTYDKIS